MLRKIRIILASLSFVLITLLFLDVSGVLHAYLGWLARIQFLPALLALNVGVVVALIALTLVFGRIYCSVICPLGVLQDGVSWLAARRRGHRFTHVPALNWLRYGVLAAFAVALMAGLGVLASLIEPYSAYGRIAMSLLAPLYAWGNNLLALIAERMDSYAFHSVEVWLKGLGPLLVAIATLATISVLAWRGGRTWCNAICPVGTALGTLARFSLFKPRIDADKCVHCGLCERGCKASCIDAKAGTIDASRCVACMDCLENCRRGAIDYGLAKKRRAGGRSEESAATVEWTPPSAQHSDGAGMESETSIQPLAAAPETGEGAGREADAGAGSGSELSRRAFLSAAGLLALEGVAQAQAIKVDGGLAPIEDKVEPQRATPLAPPGSQGWSQLDSHCTSCQLCVSACPNQVLRPSKRLEHWMRPEMSYERGYCRPECTKCASVCPTGAILPITAAEKSALQIGHAVWVKERCVVLTDGVSCDNCARHCPSGAIHMAPSDPRDLGSPRIPMIDPERCIGCGACEHLCPSRPRSAIYVEGHERHRVI